MKVCTSFLFISACAVTTAFANEAGVKVTPVQKVIELMESMLAKGKEEKHAEEVQYAAYKQFCGDTIVEKKAAIEEATQKIEQLTAAIQQGAATSAKLVKEIAALDAEISTKNDEIDAADAQRATEKADYEKTHKDYSESIDALGRAITVLKKQDYDRKQAESLIQVSRLNSLSLIPENAKHQINLFLAQGMQDLNEDLVAPEANAYEFQSGAIVQMLQKLQDKFVDERMTFEKEEMNAKHSYDMLVIDLKAQIDQASQDKSDKTAFNAKTLEQKASDEGELADTQAMKKADSVYLADLTATCSEKASAFESRQKLRADEIEAITKAIEIISSGAVAGSAEKHLPSLVETSGSALAQLRAHSVGESQTRAVVYLQQQAKLLNSRLLSTISAHVADDPFVKVKKMIKDLIIRLMEEANEEAEHKGWCDTEMTTNEQTRKEKTASVAALSAEIDILEASIAELSESITELTKAVAELEAKMSEATTLRQEEKATNTQTIKDAVEAQAAVQEATTTLKLFYEKAGEATSLVQRQEPEIFDEPYKGMQSENGGVIGFLQVIESDFARLESDTKAAEAEALKSYEKFMEDSTVDKEAKSTESDHKAAKKQDQEESLTEKKGDLEDTQKALDAALAYYDKLKPSCVDASVSFEDRVGRRQEEIQSLQEALKILNGAEIA
mmetsp:Transcript_162137/g.296038  ORF Transcript_162137/g.296038 Transcript_162137/m.296038 type:complete len:673 (-) Transcript_162137:50-2068(-)